MWLREIGLEGRIAVGAWLGKREPTRLSLWRAVMVEVKRLEGLVLLLVVGTGGGIVRLLWARVAEVIRVSVVVVPALAFICLECESVSPGTRQETALRERVEGNHNHSRTCISMKHKATFRRA